MHTKCSLLLSYGKTCSYLYSKSTFRLIQVPQGHMMSGWHQQVDSWHVNYQTAPPPPKNQPDTHPPQHHRHTRASKIAGFIKKTYKERKESAKITQNLRVVQ